MGTGPPGDKASGLRHPGQVRPIGAVLPAVTRVAFRGAGPAAAQLVADWALIVGPSLAAVSSPRRFAAGTLTLGCSGPVAMELQHLTGQLMERINGHLGRAAVQRIRIVQEAGAGRVEGKAGWGGRRAALVLPEIEGVAAGPLRDALQRLGAQVGARGWGGAIKREAGGDGSA